VVATAVEEASQRSAELLSFCQEAGVEEEYIARLEAEGLDWRDIRECSMGDFQEMGMPIAVIQKLQAQWSRTADNEEEDDPTCENAARQKAEAEEAARLAAVAEAARLQAVEDAEREKAEAEAAEAARVKAEEEFVTARVQAEKEQAAAAAADATRLEAEENAAREQAEAEAAEVLTSANGQAAAGTQDSQATTLSTPNPDPEEPEARPG